MLIHIAIVDSPFVDNTFLRWMRNDSRLSITPSANRNSYRVASRVVFLPRVEALRPSTLGYEIATPTELLLLAGYNSSLMMRPQGLYIISLLSMMYAPTTMYGYPIVDGAHSWQLLQSCCCLRAIIPR